MLSFFKKKPVLVGDSRKYQDVIALSRKGYHCAQAIACAYGELTDLDHRTIYKLTECLGGGIAKMGETCGALTGAYLIISYLSSDGLLEQGKSKSETYTKIRMLNDYFVDKMRSSQCEVLMKGVMRRTGCCDDKLLVACEAMEFTLGQMGIKIAPE